MDMQGLQACAQTLSGLFLHLFQMLQSHGLLCTLSLVKCQAPSLPSQKAGLQSLPVQVASTFNLPR